MRDFNRELENPHDEVLLRSAFDKNWTWLQKKLNRVLTSVDMPDEFDESRDPPENPPPSGRATQRPVLSEMEYNVLAQVGKRQLVQQQATARDVASALNITEEKSKYYLDELSQKHKLLDWFGNMDRSIPDRYTLTHEGRRLLVERGVI